MEAEKASYDELWRAKLRTPPTVVPLRFSAAVAELAGGARVLDVGCGRGVGHDLLAKRYREVHGVDGTEAALAQARARGTAARVVDLDAGRLPYPDAHFDAVLLLDVIEHLIDPAPIVAEIARILRPGGQAVVTTPNVRSLRQLVRIAVQGRGPRTSGDDFGVDGGHLHYFTSADVVRLCARAGLRVTEQRGLASRLPASSALTRLWPVREFLSGGLLVQATR